MTKQEPMTDEYALKYAIETLEECEYLYDPEEDAKVELHEVTQTLKYILDSYEKFPFHDLNLHLEEEDGKA
tara:strand:+ start:3699 stop:3911 length:213 start_codon:yes stop_codon:yes gene_type:complete